MQQRGRGDDQGGAGLGFAGGSWRQQQAEVAVGDSAGLQDLAEGVGAELVHCPPPPSSPWTLRDQATWPHQGVDLKGIKLAVRYQATVTIAVINRWR
jgi:hypothetical protein